MPIRINKVMMYLPQVRIIHLPTANVLTIFRWPCAGQRSDSGVGRDEILTNSRSLSVGSTNMCVYIICFHVSK